MIDRYYHDPSVGRVGPLSAETLCRHFRAGRIQRDTLVWHHGLREWQPLERMAPEPGLETLKSTPHVRPRPPRRPPLATGAATTCTLPPRGKHSCAPAPLRKCRSGG